MHFLYDQIKACFTDDALPLEVHSFGKKRLCSPCFCGSMSVSEQLSTYREKDSVIF